MTSISNQSSDVELRDVFARAGQGHVFRFWEKLSGEQRDAFLKQASQIDLKEVSRLVETLVLARAKVSVDFSKLKPAPYAALPANGGDPSTWARAKSLGEQALREGRVACFTVAGGQGSRLGFDGPKGAFPVTPVRGHTLFQVFAEKIRAAGMRHGRTPHWLIMTSPANHAATESFFQEHRFFGLDPLRVHFFQQGTMPAVDFEGRISLETPSSIALSPDGHGGSLRALARNGVLDTLRSEGVRMLSYFQVDNPLVRCVDPAFIGFHVEARSEMSSKMVPKRDANEKVGHFCLDADGRLVVIEYSDLSPKLATEKEVSGQLRFRAGSIAIHMLDLEFAARLGEGRDPSCRLPFHRADKKVAIIDETGKPINPEKPNGIKFEMFVFDALPFARNPIVIETARADDFSPVKNATGEDSPETCKADQLRQFARWMRIAGTQLPVDASGLPPFPLEIGPLFGDDEESFASGWNALKNKPALNAGLVLG